MTLRGLAAEAARALAAAGIPDAHFEAEYLARQAAGVDRAAYFAGATATPDAEAKLEEAIERRLRREPAAYITGTREFYGRPFVVGPGVLVPRPETELLVDLGLAELRADPAAVVIDVGTGSGAVAVSIAAEARGACVVATDVSRDALAIAHENARRHAPSTCLIAADLLAPFVRAGVVLANLPYIPTGEIDALEPEVSRWEPRVALDGGGDGLDLIRRLVADCANRLRPRLLALELGYGQSRDVAAILEAADAKVDIVKDLAGIERVVCGRWA